MKFHTNAILLFAFIALLSLLVLKGYIYTYLLTDFPVRAYISCSPENQSCFTTDDTDYYAYVTMSGDGYKQCSSDDTCDEFCAITGNCEIEYCTNEAGSSDEWCSKPDTTASSSEEALPKNVEVIPDTI